MERLIDSAALALAVLAAGLVGLIVVDKLAWRREFVVGGLFVPQGLSQALAAIGGRGAGRGRGGLCPPASLRRARRRSRGRCQIRRCCPFPVRQGRGQAGPVQHHHRGRCRGCRDLPARLRFRWASHRGPEGRCRASRGQCLRVRPSGRLPGAWDQARYVPVNRGCRPCRGLSRG